MPAKLAAPESIVRICEEDYIQSMLDGDLCWFIRSGDSTRTPILMEPMENPQIEQLRKVAGEEDSNGGK